MWPVVVLSLARQKLRPGSFLSLSHSPWILAADGKGTSAAVSADGSGPFIQIVQPPLALPSQNPSPGAGDPSHPSLALKVSAGCPKPDNPHQGTNLHRVSHLQLPGLGGLTRIMVLKQASYRWSPPKIVPTVPESPAITPKGRAHQRLATESQVGIKTLSSSGTGCSEH